MVWSDGVPTIFLSNLRELVSHHADPLPNAKPFSYLVMDNFFAKPDAEFLAQNLQNIPEKSWKTDTKTRVKSYDFLDLGEMNEFWRNVMYQSGHPQMLQFMENLTGISGLQPDPYYLASLQSFKNDSFEEVHIDANVHGIHHLYRRVSLIIYLNPAWREEYGGQLEIWDDEMRGCVKRIEPLFNRAVIYNFSNFYHGCPKPVISPPGVRQCFISLVYCTSQPDPDDLPADQGTLWQTRPDPTKPIPVSLDQTKLNKTQLLTLLGRYETEFRQVNQEHNSLVLQLSEAQENQHILFSNGSNFLKDRQKVNFQQAQLLQQQKAELQEKLLEQRKIDSAKRKQLLLELGMARQWTRELAQRIKD